MEASIFSGNGFFHTVLLSQRATYHCHLLLLCSCGYCKATVQTSCYRFSSDVLTSKRSEVFCSKGTIQIALVGSFWLITIYALLWKAVWWSSTATNQGTWSQLISKASHSLAPEDTSVASGVFYCISLLPFVSVHQSKRSYLHNQKVFSTFGQSHGTGD